MRPKKHLSFKHIAQNKEYTFCGVKAEHVIKYNMQLAAFRLMTVTLSARNKKMTDEWNRGVAREYYDNLSAERRVTCICLHKYLNILVLLATI